MMQLTELEQVLIATIKDIKIEALTILNYPPEHASTKNMLMKLGFIRDLANQAIAQAEKAKCEHQWYWREDIAVAASNPPIFTHQCRLCGEIRKNNHGSYRGE